MAKRLEILGELLPGTDKVGVLINPSNPNADSDTQDVLSAAVNQPASIRRKGYRTARTG
jgi:hypothetical protein